MTLRLRSSIAASAIVGAAIAAYLTYVHFAHSAPICTSGGCEQVQRSAYAKLGGVPVALLGLIAYVAVLSTTAVRGTTAAFVGAILTLAGAVFSAYLLWAQLARIHAICQWCVANDVVIAALALLCAWRLLREPASRGYNPPRPNRGA